MTPVFINRKCKMNRTCDHKEESRCAPRDNFSESQTEKATNERKHPMGFERYQGSLGPLELGLQAEVSAGTLVLRRAVRTSTLKPEPPLPHPLPFYFCSECVGKETCSALAPTVGRKVLR